MKHNGGEMEGRSESREPIYEAIRSAHSPQIMNNRVYHDPNYAYGRAKQLKASSPLPDVYSSPSNRAEDYYGGSRQVNRAIHGVKRPKKNSFLISDEERIRMQKARNKISRASEIYTKDIQKAIQGRNGLNWRTLMLSFGCLFSGILGYASYDSIVDYSMDALLQLKPGGILTWAWGYNPIPIVGDFYLLELLNGPEWLKGQKPSIRKLGPFSFNMYRRRRVLGYSEDKVEFLESYEMYPNPDASLPMDTSVRMINFPIFGSLTAVDSLLKKFYLSFTRPIVYNIVVTALKASGEEVIETRLAREVFAGRKIKLLDILESYGLQPLRNMGLPVPEVGLGNFKLRNATFGFMTLLAGVEFGPYEAWRASENGHIASHFVAYRGNPNLPNYSPPCNRIQGSDGILLGRKSQGERIYIYNHLACRHFTLVKKGVEYYNGIRTIRYEADVNMFNASHPRYRCYCFEDDQRECDGWINASGCFEDLKIAISFPNFFNCPRRQRALRGLSNDPSESLTYLNVEPNLGVPLNAVIALQGSFVLSGMSSVPSLSSIQDVMFPIFIVRLRLGANWWQSIGALIGVNALQFGSYGLLFSGLGAAGYSVYRKVKKPTK